MFCAFLISFVAFIALISAVPQWHQLEDYTFEQYTKDFKKIYAPKELTLRRLTFEQRLKEHKIHNADITKTWKVGVNHLTDHTQEEFESMLGGNKAHHQHKKFGKVSKTGLKGLKNAQLEVDWRTKGVISPVKDQGRCGSCWSFAAAETVESYYAIANPGKMKTLSEQQILDCTPNPLQCGGSGGCGGATAELAFQQIIDMGGLSSEWTYPYTSYFGDGGACNPTRFIPTAKISAYVNIPSNNVQAVMEHLLHNGPLAVSVDASTWSQYESGVFDGCNQVNPDLDHAVQLVGMGTDSQLGDYWTIRNSWAPLWGESGFIRLRKTSTPRCGMDNTPLHGDGCVNTSKPEYVCGTCGVLFDALYPVIQH